MATPAENITKAIADFDDIQAAIIEQGVAVPPGTPTSEYGNKVREIQGGVWKPHSDWWDIETTVNTGVLEWSGATVPNVRYGYVVVDSYDTTTLAAGYEYYLSDGAYYNGASTVVHTWDKSKDKPCAEGYRTRAVIVCKAARDVAISQRAHALDGIASLYLYLGDCSITAITFNGSSSNANANRTLRAMRHNESAQISGNIFANYTFRDCVSLLSIHIPPGSTNMSNYACVGCGSLRELVTSQTMTSYGVQTLYTTYAMPVIQIPERIKDIGNQAFANTNIQVIDFLPLNATIAGNAFGSWALVAFKVQPGFASSINLSGSPHLSISSMEQMINHAAQRSPQNAITFTLGAANLDRLSDEIKLFAAANGITLA